MEKSVTTMYEPIGGADAVEVAVNRLYDRMLTDPVLAPAFVGVDMRTLRTHMALYLAEAFTDRPDSPWDLAAAHAQLHITERMFDAVVIHLVSVLEELGVEADHIDEAIDRLAAQRRAVVTVPSPERPR